MKSPKRSFAALSLLLVFAACKKNDFKDMSVSENQEISSAIDSSSIKVSSSDWTSAAEWNVETVESISLFHSNLSAPTITEDVANNGLVLVYKSSGDAVATLPQMDNNTSLYWYYQVTKGNVMISVDANNNTAKPSNAVQFKYFVITPEQLQVFEQQGKSRADLMALSYENAQSLLN